MLFIILAGLVYANSNPILDLFVSTNELSLGQPNVIENGLAVAPWNDYSTVIPLVDDSSYQEFFIGAATPREVNIVCESSDMQGQTPFVFLTIPEPDHKQKVHVTQDLNLCSEGEAFYLYFNCVTAGYSNVTVIISEGLNRSKFMFQKHCQRGGLRQDLAILVNGEAVVSEGDVAGEWLDGSKVLNGTVTFSMSIGQGNQYIESVTLTSQALVEPRGPAAKGAYLSPHPLDLVVLVKECKIEKVSLVLKMPPYDFLRLSWTNYCQPPLLESVDVPPEVSLTFLYSTETYSLASNSSVLMSIPPQENELKFYLSTDETLPISQPLLTFKQ